MRHALAALLLLTLAACDPAQQSETVSAAPAAAAPTPMTPAHNGGRFQVVVGRSFEIVLDPAIPPATLWRLVETPGFINHMQPAGGSIMGGEPPETSYFVFFAGTPGEGDIVLTASDGAQFRVKIVAVTEEATAWRDPFAGQAGAAAPTQASLSPLRLGVENNRGRVEAAVGQYIEVSIQGSPSRGDALEATSVPAFLSPSFESLPGEGGQDDWGGSTMMSLAFVVAGPGEGELVVNIVDERANQLGREVLRVTIVAR